MVPVRSVPVLRSNDPGTRVLAIFFTVMGLSKEKEMPGAFKALVGKVMDTAKGQKGIDALTGATQPGKTKQRWAKGY